MQRAEFEVKMANILTLLYLTDSFPKADIDKLIPHIKPLCYPFGRFTCLKADLADTAIPFSTICLHFEQNNSYK